MTERQIPGQIDIFGNIEPEPPAQKHSATSKAAAETVRGTAKPMRQQILDLLRKEGAMTDADIAIRSGLGENTARPRRIELCRNGQVVKAGVMVNANKREASLWAATKPEGEAL